MTEIRDHSAEIERELKRRIGLALEACGLTAEGYAKLNLTEKGAVDTGNLRNSVTHQTDGKEKVYVGTNQSGHPLLMGTTEQRQRHIH